LETVVEHGEQVIGNDALEGVAVEEAQAEPEAIEFGATQESLALGSEVGFKIADEINGADLSERQFLVLAVGSEQVHRVNLAET